MPAHVGMISPLLLEEELEEEETAPDDELELEDELEEEDDDELAGVTQKASPGKNEVAGWSVQPGPSRGGPSASIEPQIGTLPELAMQAGKLPEGHLINPL